MAKAPLTITVLHNIFLTREQRYSLADGNTVECVGVSVPVWFKNGKTNEPGQEVFCKYKIHNRPKPMPIQMWKEGYEINLPQEDEKMLKLVDPMASTLLIGENVTPPTGKNLKDAQDHGCAEVVFKQYTKVHKDKEIFNMLHFVEIKDISVLEESMAMCSCEET